MRLVGEGELSRIDVYPHWRRKARGDAGSPKGSEQDSARHQYQELVDRVGVCVDGGRGVGLCG
jgi:hypothetical protein